MFYFSNKRICLDEIKEGQERVNILIQRILKVIISNRRIS